MPGQMTLADGARLRVRPIVPADREPLADAFDRLSDRSRHQRFLAPKPRLSARELDYLTDVDHVTHEALVAIDETTGDIVGGRALRDRQRRRRGGRHGPGRRGSRGSAAASATASRCASSSAPARTGSRG